MSRCRWWIKAFDDGNNLSVGYILEMPRQPAPSWLPLVGQRLEIADYPALYLVVGKAYNPDVEDGFFYLCDTREPGSSSPDVAHQHP